MVQFVTRLSLPTASLPNLMINVTFFHFSYLFSFLHILDLVSDQDDCTLALSHQEPFDAFLEEVTANMHVQGRQGIVLRAENRGD